MYFRCVALAVVASSSALLGGLASAAPLVSRPYFSARAYEHRMRAELLARHGDAAGAVDSWRLARVYDPGSAHLALGLVEALWRVGLPATDRRLHTALRDATRLAPGPAALWRGRIALGNGEVWQAERSFALAVKLAGDSPAGLAARVESAEMWLASGRRLAAKRALERVAALAHPDLAVGTQTAGLLLDAGALEQAAALADRLRRQHGAEPGVLAVLAEAHRRADQRAVDINRWRRRVAQAPADPDVLLAALRESLRAGADTESAACLDALLTLDTDGTNRFRAALVHMEAHRLTTAAQLLGEARRLRPADPIVLEAHTRALAQAGKRASAIAALREVAPGAVAYAASRRQLAALHVAAGRTGDAIEVLESARKVVDDAALTADLADLYVRGGRVRAALQLAEQHRRVHGATAGLLAKEVALLADQGDVDRALALSGAAAELGSVAEVAVARALAGHGQLVAAERVVAAVLRRDGADRGALIALAELRVASGGDLAGVAERIDAAVIAAPDDAGLWGALGGVHLALGATSPAQAALERAHANAPDDPIIAERLGDARTIGGDDSGAERAYRACAAILMRQVLARVPGAKARLAMVARKRMR